MGVFALDVLGFPFRGWDSTAGLGQAFDRRNCIGRAQTAQDGEARESSENSGRPTAFKPDQQESLAIQRSDRAGVPEFRDWTGKIDGGPGMCRG